METDSEFQEWWDTFVNALCVVRPGVREAMRELYKKRRREKTNEMKRGEPKGERIEGEED